MVSVDMNKELLCSFTRDEVGAALKTMASARGSDGMPPTLFQTYWSVIGDDVSFVVLNCPTNCSMSVEINHTFITLISKVKSLEKIVHLV